MRWTLTTIIALVLAAAPVRAQGTWTILFYMASDEAHQADLEDWTIRSIQSMTNVGTPQGVTVLVQSDRGQLVSGLDRQVYPDPDHTGGARYRVSRGTWEYLEKMNEPNMGDPNTLEDFLRWGVRTAPAQQYMLVIVSHGSGTMSWRGPGAVGARLPGEVRLSSYVAYDDTDNDCLTLPELSAVLEKFKGERGGRALEVLTLDACLPSTMEAFFQLRSSCQVMIGSASQVIMGKFDYAGALGALSTNPALGPEQLADVIVRGFINNSQSGNQVMTALRTSAADELAGAVDRFAQEMIRARNEVGGLKFDRVTFYELGKDKMYWDLKVIADRVRDPANGLNGASNAAALREAATDVVRALQSARVSMWYMGDFQSNQTGGVSLYWPPAETYRGHRSYYKVLELSKVAHWDDHLDQIHGYSTQP